MRILVNSLSVGSLSGRHVLFGHLEQLARMANGEHEFLLLHRPEEDLLPVAGLPGIRPLCAPSHCGYWLVRSLWEASTLPALMKRERVDCYFSPTGTILPSSPVPQATLAQNPWCMVPELPKGPAKQVKAVLQRQAYRRAFKRADLMVYNSRHMRELYARNAPGLKEKDFRIVYQGIDEQTFEAADRLRGVEKVPGTILTVSVMASWKGIEVTVEALRQLRQRHVDAKLILVGPWADQVYRRRIERLVVESRLSDLVTIAGKASKEELHHHYARAKVFCLMSRCESFGIPAVEAQAFGTPVVGSSVCAMEEVCGAGGECTTPDRPDLVADLLERLLMNEGHWAEMSQRASANAHKYHWSECSQPISALFDLGKPPLVPSANPEVAGVV